VIVGLRRQFAEELSSGRLQLARSHPAVPWIWPCRSGNEKQQRATRPHERCEKPCAGMRPKGKATPSRR
jgi:hypothetical protein